MTRIMVPVALAMLVFQTSGAATVTFNGGVTNQAIDGFGANINYRSWNTNELEPVLDALIDQGGMTLFRVVYDNADWEASNDNTDPNSFNWSYYNGVYNSTEFNRLWDIFGYLNTRGITNGAFFNFMGPGPNWLGGSDLTIGMESEWAEMIASLLSYARNTRGLQFKLVAPDNEPNWTFPEGIHIYTANQYATALHKLADRLDSAGMNDVGFVGPDLSGSMGTGYMPQMMADPVIMSKLRHFGIHDYTPNGGTAGTVADYISNSSYPDRTLWMTEFGECAGNACEDGTSGESLNTWSGARQTATDLLYYIWNGASGGQVWEGYDSRYKHAGLTKWSYWGLFRVNDPNAVVKTYSPRKLFYTHSQVIKWIRPGSQRINVTGTTTPFTPLLAFKHSGLGQITIVGINTSTSASALNGTLASLPGVPQLDLYYTSATTNLANGGSVPVNSGTFSATIPANCVFTLTYFTPSPLVVTTTNLPSAQIGEGYSFPLAASGGSPPYVWGVASNASAPAGLTLSTNGLMSGVPSSAGQFNFPVVVADSTMAQVSQEVNLGIVELILTLGAPPQTADEIGSLGFRLTLSANLPGTYLIQRTPNFSAWEDVHEVIYTNGVVQVTNHNGTAASALFYRAFRPLTVR